MNTDRIKRMAKMQGKSVTYICKLIGRPKYYLNDVAKSEGACISDEDLKTIAIDLNTSVEYLRGETDDPSFDLSTVGLSILPTSPQPLRPIFGQASAGTGILAHH